MVVYQTTFSGPNANKNAAAGNKYAVKWRITRHSQCLNASLRWNISRQREELPPGKAVKRSPAGEKNEISIAFYSASPFGFSQ
ncbi:MULTISPECIES: hypothetical protein [Pantoea]|uniref:hypothetical protein n=1 Tax=Pantoea TaxID=53335 RepID=UPI0028936908|nr:hypothetical protein [Pantoea sp. UBA5923]